MKRSWHLVAYDVRDEQRLRRVMKVIEGYGGRVQLSVFRCRLSAETRAELLWRLSQLMTAEDSLLIVPLCDSCVGGIIERGTTRTWPLQPPEYAVY